MAKHSVTNVTNGPRGFYSGDTLVMLEAGESTREPVELSDVEIEHGKATGYFAFDGKGPGAQQADLEGLDLNGLIEVMVNEGLIESAATITDDLRSAIMSKREFLAQQAAEDEEAAEPGPIDGSIEALTAHLATVDDADEIDRLIDAETAGKSRKGALEALEARKQELESE